MTRVSYTVQESGGETDPTDEPETGPTEGPAEPSEPADTPAPRPTADPSGATAPDAPSGLLTNELEAPMNAETVYFGWLVNDADENDYQTAYRITVTDGITGETAWDSGKVESSEQSYIECGTEPEAGISVFMEGHDVGQRGA